jgi:hypothetical protein
MDQNTKLIIANAARSENWEDQEKANDDVTLLQAEFDQRLPKKIEQGAVEKKGAEEPKKD